MQVHRFDVTNFHRKHDTLSQRIEKRQYFSRHFLTNKCCWFGTSVRSLIVSLCDISLNQYVQS